MDFGSPEFWSTTWQVSLVSILVIFIISVIRASIRPEKFPPGPFSLPLVGYLPFLDVRNLGKSFKRLAARHGEIFSVSVGKKHVVVLSSFDAIQDAFSRKEFSGRPNMYSGTFVQKGKSGVSTTEGELWEAQREFLHDRMVELVSGKSSAVFLDAVMDEIHDLKTEFAKRVGEPVPAGYNLNVAVLNLMLTVTSGRRMHAQQQEFQTVYECVDKVTQFMSRAAIMSFLPFLARIVPESITKMEKGRYHRDRFHKLSRKWIREHKEDYRGDRVEDFQDKYLQKVFAGEQHFTEENLGAILREMFVIGAEATSGVLRWGVRILCVNKEAQRLMQDEIDDVIEKDKDVTWEDRKKLPYVRAAIAEIHRFTDLTPTGIGHKTRCDVDFRGFHLPEGTHVLSNLTSCHRDPKYWKKALEFTPENFLDDQGQYIENKEGFAPFGIGVRKCPAEEVAMLETFLILSNLVKAFTMRCPPGDMMNIGTQYQAGTGFIRYPKPYKVVFQPRD